MKNIEKVRLYYKNHRWVRIFSKSLLIFLGLYILLLSVLSIYINSNKEKFIYRVNEQIENNIQGKVSLKNADITVWRSFPNIAVVLENISIKDSVYNISFLQMKKVEAHLNIFSLIGKKTKINSVKLYTGRIRIFTDGKGYNNTYVIKNDQHIDTAKKKKSLLIKNIELNNVTFLNEHHIKNKRHSLVIKNLDADIKDKNEIYTIHMKEEVLVKGLGFNLSRGFYLNNQTIEGKWDIVYKPADRSISFDETKVYFNDHPMYLKGSFWLKDNPHFSLHLNTEDLSYNQARELMPQNVQVKLDKVQLSKPVDIIADIAGPMAYRTTPEVSVKWSTELTQLTTPVTILDSCSFSGGYTNRVNKNTPISNENSAITLNDFTGTWGDVLLSGNDIVIYNLTNPAIRFELKSSCTFQQLDKQLSLETIHFLKGDAQLAVNYNGLLIADPAMLTKLEFALKMKNGTVEYAPRNMVFTNVNGEVIFSENKLQAKNLECNVKDNHFVVNIEGNELNKVSESISGKANIYCSVFSPALNLQDFTTLFSPTVKKVRKQKGKKQPTLSAIDGILEKGSLQLNFKANTIHMKKFDAQNAIAQVLFEENKWQIQRAYLKHAKGSMDLKASFIQAGKYHDATVSANMKNLDVRELFYAFNDFGQSGISYYNLRGIINSDANIRIKMNERGEILPGTMNGLVHFSLNNGVLINYEPMQKIKKFAFKNRNLDKIEFAELKNTLEINNYDIKINRMEITSTVFTFFVEGVYSLKDKTNITIQVPISNLKKRDDDFKLKNKGVNAKTGPSLFFRAKPGDDGKINISLDLLGRFRKEDVEKVE